jgi:tetratricopeptide (TPR) repeat protein
MDNELASMLRQGIAAAKAGDHELAREFLTRIVERDERNLNAWLWLSEVVTNPDERQVCLENVLTLDPGNRAAQRGLALLHEQQAGPRRRAIPSAQAQHQAPSMAAAILRGPQPDDDANVRDASRRGASERVEREGEDLYTPPLLGEMYAASTAPSPTMAAAIFQAPSALDEAQAEADSQLAGYQAPIMAPTDYPRGPASADTFVEDYAKLREFEEEYLCPYCATLTQPDAQACPACGGQLWRGVRRSEKRSAKLWIVLTVLLGTAGIQSLAFLMWGLMFIQPFFTAGKITLDQFINLYMGLGTAPPDVAAALFARLPPLVLWGALFAIGIQVSVAALVYSRWPPIYWIGAALIGLAAAPPIAQIIVSRQLSLQSLGSAGLAVLPLFFWASLHDDFKIDRKRIFCELDKSIKSHSAFYMHGRDYARQGMWTLAAIHFKRAVGAAPHMIAYHLALAAAYARLKRYERATSVLDEAHRLAPDDPKVHQMSERIAQEYAQHVPPGEL